jgi:hypothetical protein
VNEEVVALDYFIAKFFVAPPLTAASLFCDHGD